MLSLLRPALVLASLALAAGCASNVTTFTTARPVPVGDFEMGVALSPHLLVTSSEELAPFATVDWTTRIGADERVDVGIRVGFPTGVGADVKVLLLDTELVRLAVLPGLGVNPFRGEERQRHGTFEVPLLVDFALGRHTLTVGGRYGLLAYFAPEPSDSIWAHAAGVELAVHFAIGHAFVLAPYVGWRRVVAGKFVEGRDNVGFGVAARFP